ncbi:MAG: aminotransferase class III-fold pyridoxal phosphate-dependent enzyme, partial [Acidobacteriota bacterium]
DAAYTLQVGRRAFGHRRVLVCAERDAAIRALRAPAATGLAGETPGARRRSVAFLFPGQGVQRLDMGRQLYRSEAVFRRHVDRCAELFEPCLGLDLRHLLFPNGEDRDEAAQRLNQTRYSQPALFTVELALARLWMAWGVVPSAMIGHSLGEYTAAVVAETLALPEAAAVVAERGRMMHALPAGAMLTVPLGSEELTPLLGADLELAAFNAPARTVVSGQLAAVTALERRLAARKVPARRLETAHAFHSAMVEPIVEEFARVMRQVDLREPRIPWVSNVTGTWITTEEATDPTYWARHLRQPVRFAEALEHLVGDEPPLLLEVGPGRSLTALARRHAAIGPADAIPSFPVKRGVDEIEAMLQALGQLWLAGTEVDWQRLHAEAPRRRISLPPTPFERQRYWIDPQPVPPTRDSSAAALEQTVAQHVEVLSQQLETLRRSLPAVPTNGAVRQQETPAPPQRAERQLGAAAAPPPPRSFGPWRPPASTPSRALNGHQRRHLEALIERYVRRTAESKRRTSEQRPVLADVRASMGFRQPWKELVYPITARRSAGSRLWDIDGNEYLDLVMGFGVNLFGHSPPFITRAIAEQLERGVHLGPQSDLAGEVATAIRELTGCQRVTFCNTGSEAVTIALRLARTATGRSRIAWFDGSYHGLADSVLGRPQGSGSHRRIVPAALGIPTSMVADSLVLDYAQEASLEILERHAGEVAAVLVEPVQAGRPACDPSEFLQQLRQLTERLGIALIFDEMITGFRIHPGGAQAYFGVEADLATYGKVVGGGLPIGVIAGRRDFMDAVDGGFWDYGDDSYPHVPQTFVAGTFCKHPLALAAARATLQHLRQEGPALQQRLDEQSAALTAELDALFAARGLPLHMERFASLFYFRLPKELAFADLFQYFMLEQGIHLWGSLRCFLSTAHQPADLEQIVAAASA